MKILLVTNGFPPTALGGVEVYTYDLARGLSNKGYQVSVLCREADFTRPDSTVIKDTQFDYPVTRIVNDYKNVSHFRYTFENEHIEDIFQEYISSTAPDLIHFNHTIALSARLPLIAARYKIPSLLTLHDYWPLCHRVQLIDWRGEMCPGPMKGGNCPTCVLGEPIRQVFPKTFTSAVWLAKSLIPLRLRVLLRGSKPENTSRPAAWVADKDTFQERYELFQQSILATQCLLVPSHYVRRQFADNGYPEDKIEVLPLGIGIPTTKQTFVKNKTPITFSIIGTFIRNKGIDVAVRAFKQVTASNICLKIFGREDIQPLSYSKEVRQLAEEDPRIQIMGPFSPEQREVIYQGTDVLIVPSIFPETFSLVAREALARGKPVIASNIGALPEAISEGINGFLFEPGDHQQLAQIIGYIAQNPACIAEMKCPGPTTILSVDEHIEAIAERYNAILPSA